jgi:fatty-acyl-CoA synthase
VLTQEALIANARNGVDAHALTGNDQVLTFLPMFHVGGLNIQTLPALFVGAAVTLQRRFEPGAALDAIAAVRPSLVLLVPAVMKAMIEHPRWMATDLSSIRLAMAGSSIVPVELIRAFHARGVPVGQVYGSTETGPTAIVLKGDDAMRKEGSTGTPALLCDVRVVDDAGRDVARGQAGEILVRGPNVMRGYWNDSSATAEALIDGWFHTGDVGHQDSEGYFWIDERKKDMIISGGENIYPAELEAVIAECAGVAEASVVARPDAKWGEVPVAVIVRRNGASVTAAEIKTLFEGRLARFKHPHDVVFVEALPRNVMGKVLRYKLRESVRRP